MLMAQIAWSLFLGTMVFSLLAFLEVGIKALIKKHIKNKMAIRITKINPNHKDLRNLK